MRVESPDADHRVFGQTQPRRPFGADPTRGLIRSIGLVRNTFRKAGQQRVQGRKKAVRWQTPELFRPQGFMPGSTDASFDLVGVAAAGKQERDPVAVLHPTETGFRYRLILPEDAKQLRPEPFRGINTPHIFQVIGFAAAIVFVDGFRFVHRRMVFPKHEHGVGIVLESREQRERRTGGIHRYRSGTGGVDGNGPDSRPHLGSHLVEAGPDAGFQSLNIVQGVLPELLSGRITIQVCFPAWIIEDRRSQFLARCRVNNYGANRVRTIVYTNYIVVAFHPFVFCLFNGRMELRVYIPTWIMFHPFILLVML